MQIPGILEALGQELRTKVKYLLFFIPQWLVTEHQIHEAKLTERKGEIDSSTINLEILILQSH